MNSENRVTLADLFADSVRIRPDAVAVVQDGRAWTYAELDRAAERVAAALAARGLGRGDRVALLFGNDATFVPVLFGVLRAGGVAVPVNVRLGAAAIAYVVRDSGARLVAVAPGYASLALPVTAVKADELLAHGDGRRSSVTVEAEDLALQPYTSGSTGNPKGVPLTHGGQVWNATTVRDAIGIDQDTRALLAVPLFHANAMSGAVLPVLLAGGTLVVLEAFDAAAFAQALRRHDITYTTGVPAMYRMVLDVLDAPVPGLRKAMIGSAPVSVALLEELQRAFPNAAVLEGYGLTEGGPVVSTNTPGAARVGTIGRPLPGCEIRIVASDGGDVVAGDVGELWVRSPGVTVGYHDLPEVTAARITADGWLSTGDLVADAGDGYLVFRGRVDDMLNVGGENVYPREVEEILLTHRGVTDAVVVGAPHGVKGEVPVAFVVTSETVEADELRRYFLARGPAYAHPRIIQVLPAMPVGSTGKIDRAALMARAKELV